MKQLTGSLLIAISAASFGTLAIFGRFLYDDGLDTFIVLVATVIPVVAFLAGLERIGPTNTAMLSTLEPVVTVFLAAWIFEERLQLIVMLGGGLILVAVILLTRGELEKKASLRNTVID